LQFKFNFCPQKFAFKNGCPQDNSKHFLPIMKGSIIPTNHRKSYVPGANNSAFVRRSSLGNSWTQDESQSAEARNFGIAAKLSMPMVIGFMGLVIALTVSGFGVVLYWSSQQGLSQKNQLVEFDRDPVGVDEDAMVKRANQIVSKAARGLQAKVNHRMAAITEKIIDNSKQIDAIYGNLYAINSEKKFNDEFSKMFIFSDYSRGIRILDNSNLTSIPEGSASNNVYTDKRVVWGLHFWASDAEKNPINS
jgi:hypothetical protein